MSSEYKYTLPKFWIDIIRNYPEFIMGGMLVSVKVKDGRVFKEVLISNSTWIIAMRGHKDLPFEIEDIVDIFQTEDDKNMTRREFYKRGGWFYWDETARRFRGGHDLMPDESYGKNP